MADLGLRLAEIREFVYLPWRKQPLRYRAASRRSAPSADQRTAGLESASLWRRLGLASRPLIR